MRCGQLMGGHRVINPKESSPAFPTTILVVEDEVLIRMALADTLREAGFSVVEASNANEAVELVTAGVKPHVLFTDVRMPGGADGLDLASFLSAQLPHLIVFVCSGHLSGTADASGIKNFIPKPFDAGDVVKRIKAALRNE
jgi:DNA-binding NtrC family response regulator